MKVLSYFFSGVFRVTKATNAYLYTEERPALSLLRRDVPRLPLTTDSLNKKFRLCLEERIS